MVSELQYVPTCAEELNIPPKACHFRRRFLAQPEQYYIILDCSIGATVVILCEQNDHSDRQVTVSILYSATIHFIYASSTGPSDSPSDTMLPQETKFRKHIGLDTPPEQTASQACARVLTTVRLLRLFENILVFLVNHVVLIIWFVWLLLQYSIQNICIYN